MIVLSNINLEFDRPLVKNGKIIVPDHKVTVITGKSGSGKTSLLYLIGLISSNTEYKYEFDKLDVNLSSDREISQIRKKQIGYVFQENSLIECLTIGDNLKYAAEIAGLTITEKDILNYLKQVSLEVDIKKYPRALSGGERQRLAIACAMAKQPELIIADEPTSALDKDNSILIIKILKEFAEKYKKKVVIASHNNLVIEFADVVYEIHDQEIIMKSGGTSDADLQKSFSQTHKVFGFVHSIKYAFKSMKRKKFQKLNMMILCALSIALATSISGIGDGLVKHQSDLLENISKREVFLINFTAPIQSYVDVDENLSISHDDAKKIKDISSISSYYPYLEFRSTGYDVINNVMFDSCSLNINSEQGKNTYNFRAGSDNNFKNVTIVPYYNEENIDKRIFKKFDNVSKDKIYLSYEFANIIDLIDNINSNIQISVDVGIPVGTTDVDLNVSSNKETYKADVDLSAKTQLNFDVSGILDHDFTNSHSASGNAVIYMPIQTMLKYMNDAKANIKVDTLNKNVQCNEWKPSAYVTLVKDYNDIGVTIKKLESINPNFKAVSEYQDIKSMNEMVSNVKFTASWIILVILLIVFVLMAIIYINDMVARKYEFAILKANGLNNKETMKIAISESIIQLLCIITLSLIATIIISLIVNQLFIFNVLTLSLKAILIIIVISPLSVLIPTVGSIAVMNRVKPDHILRN